jgi:hypothetical protein
MQLRQAEAEVQVAQGEVQRVQVLVESQYPMVQEVQEEGAVQVSHCAGQMVQVVGEAR